MTFESVSRNDMPQELWDRAMDEDKPLDRDSVRAMLPAAWSGAEWPEDALGSPEWIDLFEFAGYLGDAPQPTGPLTIFRGAVDDGGEHARRMAWTMDLERARWFAKRCVLLWQSSAAVYQATVDPDQILAIFLHERDEFEVVVHPEFLEVQIIEKYPVPPKP